MSLLGTPVYANNATPLWLSTQGDVVTGDLTFVPPASVNWVDASGNDLGRIVAVGPASNSQLYIQDNNQINFGLVGQSSTNTTLFVDAYGGQDLFRIDGQVDTDELALKNTQSIGTWTIPIGQSNSTYTYTNPHIIAPYVFVQSFGNVSAGPTLGSGQGKLMVTNVTNSNFTVACVDASGIGQTVADTAVSFLWMAVDPVA